MMHFQDDSMSNTECWAGPPKDAVHYAHRHPTGFPQLFDYLLCRPS